MRKILITGGYGFIGSCVALHWLLRYPNDQVYNLDGFTYAARPKFLRDEVHALKPENDRYREVVCDITKMDAVQHYFNVIEPDHVIHLAAESHVCRSIEGPSVFFKTNVMGTYNLLECFRRLWGGEKDHRFYHVSTDEVFGELALKEESFHELTRIKPRSPYAASKAASDHMVQSYHHTYGLNTVISNCSNNFGPNQHEEKLIPKTIKALMTGEKMTVYGPGSQIRDWIYVWDHVRAIDFIFHRAPAGERYCVGGEQQITNLNVIKFVESCYRLMTKKETQLEIIHTLDRPTDDFRYAVSNQKLHALGLGREYFTPLQAAMRATIQWYLDNGDWK